MRELIGLDLDTTADGMWAGIGVGAGWLSVVGVGSGGRGDLKVACKLKFAPRCRSLLAGGERYPGS